MSNNFTKIPLRILFVLFIFSTQNLYGIVDYHHPDILPPSQQTEVLKKAERIKKQQQKRIKKIERKTERKTDKYQQKKEESEKTKQGILVAGLFFLLIGILLIISAISLGLSLPILDGLIVLSIGAPCAIVGIALLLVHTFK